ncbi:hypothetical protein [Bacillus sp. Marseille-P3800]|uniref:hypothetical protein n=1 Tax=Bacillus sp. Marseille-P3800 TaxID=2014782 RepID=UPI000C06ECC9|nr:hypothetical protein [Bacillus sp. Marseille-P3800]
MLVKELYDISVSKSKENTRKLDKSERLKDIIESHKKEMLQVASSSGLMRCKVCYTINEDAELINFFEAGLESLIERYVSNKFEDEFFNSHCYFEDNGELAVTTEWNRGSIFYQFSVEEDKDS